MVVWPVRAPSDIAVIWAAALVVRRRRRGGVDGDVLLVFRIYGAMAARRVSVERGTPASHSSATATVKASSVATCCLGLVALSVGSPRKDATTSIGRPLLCMGQGAMAKALPILWVGDGDVFGHRLLPWKRQPKGPLSLCGVFFLGV
jgi:hypothetical protein